jgi:hypothetical protein
MNRRIGALLVACVISMTGAAVADTKIVQQTHQDAFSMMGRNQPAKDEEQVTWIGSDRMRVDQGASSMIVRLDLKKMIFLDHTNKTASTVELPFDLKEYLPPQMGEQMLQMMTFDVTVTPADEARTIGEWQTKRFDVVMKSAMVTMESVYWVTSDVEIDLSIYNALYEHILAAQPGLGSLAAELRKLNGFPIAQEGVMKMSMMGDTTIGMSTTTVSIDQVDPPAGTFDPPPDYSDEPFDFAKRMQQQQ